MSNVNRTKLFNDWAATYDHSVINTDDFPFAGYEQVLDEIVRQSHVQTDSLVLDVGTGTGNVAKRFVAEGCTVWGIDFSLEMIVQAQAKVPQATFVQTDILGSWPDAVNQTFDVIVAAYVLHEFDDVTKLQFIRRLLQHHLPPMGRIVIGDIAFTTTQAREQAHQQLKNQWDEDEHYWAADEMLELSKDVGLEAEYLQVSWCAGVFVITKKV
jgi:putative AdoMet-dependent methyltransferase